jgi:hypothetical protein
MTKTLRKIIASWDHTQQHESADYFIDVDEMEQLVGRGGCGDWNQLAKFHKDYKPTITPIDTWICWDTPVGLYLYCLANLPVMLAYRPYRKSDNEFTFISAERAAMMKDAWFQSQIDFEVSGNFLSVDDMNSTVGPLREGYIVAQDWRKALMKDHKNE